MTPNAASPAAAAVVALALLGSLSPTTGFVPTASRGQVTRHVNTRRSSGFSGPAHMSAPPPRSRRQRQPPSCFAPTAATGHRRHQQPQHQQQQRASPHRRVFEGKLTISNASPRLPALRPLSVGGDGFDDIDPLEEGPDPDAVLLQGEPELLRQQEEEEAYEAELAAAAAALAAVKKAPTKKQMAEEAVEAAVAQMGVGDGGSVRDEDAMMVSLDPKKKKKTSRVKIDPLMPKGSVAPNEWLEMANLEEGCRGVLVICHTNLPKDKKKAAKLIQAVKARYGNLIHTHEWWDDDPELDDDTREEINNFEVWLEGPTLVHYHERAEGKVEFEDEHMQRILDDLECRVVDEAILGQYVNEVFQFDLPGFTGPEQREKQFPEL